LNFRKKSTALAVLEMMENISNAINTKSNAFGIILDLAKVLIRLITVFFGIRDKPLEFLSSFLRDRQQFVVYIHTESGQLGVSHGIPQGSILGPILFLNM